MYLNTHSLVQRDLNQKFQDYTDNFTSWDKCMDTKACKIPVIVGICVGSLIIFTFLWCFIRCCMCGYACCSCCCGGCGGRRTKHTKEIVHTGPMPVQFHPSDNAGPQYAYYETRSADALPPMPSIDNKTEVHIPVDNKEIELSPISNDRMRAPSPHAAMPGFEGPGMGPRRASPAGSGYTDMVPPRRKLSDGGALYSGTNFQGPTQSPRPVHLGQPTFLDHQNRLDQRGGYPQQDMQMPQQQAYGYQGPDPRGMEYRQHTQMDGRKPQEWSVI
ncbi:hypothetical protein EX30DRAFT_131640 [Ascodesmis nigricans]|uniref:Uncharacterized protein n=1 Tax=Ascodesmis nigricans TaxID=341454 RepID=A0A4S2MSD6_9PEZI|nr:hypothetical protein EX30DRAFT_131640 [Ascodesmis nigricans]